MNAEFNTGQPIKGMKTATRSPRRKPMVVPFKCDVHGWMNAYAGVLDHPYFAVSSATARSASRTCRPAPTRWRRGTRSSGTQTLEVTVAAKESKADANFTFKAAAGAN